MNFDVQHLEVIAVSWMAAVAAFAVVTPFAFALAFLLIREDHPEPVAARAVPKPAAEATPEPVRVGMPVGAM